MGVTCFYFADVVEVVTSDSDTDDEPPKRKKRFSTKKPGKKPRGIKI